MSCDFTYMWNLMNKIEPEAWKHGTDEQMSEGRENRGLDKKVETLAKEHIYNPDTQTTGW